MKIWLTFQFPSLLLFYSTTIYANELVGTKNCSEEIKLFFSISK